MKNLKTLGAAFILTLLLSLATFAGEMNSPPCGPPEPGQTSTPPCAAAQMAVDPVTPGQTECPPAAAMVEASALTINLFESLLLL